MGAEVARECESRERMDWEGVNRTDRVEVWSKWEKEEENERERRKEE